MSVEHPYVGIDVSKAQLDIAVSAPVQQWSVANEAASLSQLAIQLHELSPALVVLEATGGMEIPVAAALAAAGVQVAIVNPRQVRDFARATGKLAKTDRLDAQVLAQFAAAVRPSPRPLPDDQALALAALLSRRRQIVGMLTEEKNRLHTCLKPVHGDIQQHIAWLQQRLDKLDKDLDDAIRQSPVWCEKEDLLRGVPGVGPVLSLTLLAELPELGSLTHKQVAALAGVAPLNRDSGAYRGKRSVWGGRAQLRAALYMGTLVATRHNPVIRAFYQRLLAAGKAKKVALTACMRKLLVILNAMLKHWTPWTYTVPQTMGPCS